MDITLLKTFLEVAATGSFVSAADRLLVTQSAVSLRIQRLEDTMGKPLFTRSRAGAEMTPAGRLFERYALSMIRTWEEARQQIAIPPGFTRSLSIGAQQSLWPRLGFRLIDGLRLQMPDLNIRAELGMPDRLTRLLVEGVVQLALLYTPQLRPGLKVTRIMEEELVLVAPWPNPTMDLKGRYALVDWGSEFIRAHAAELPELTNPGLTLALAAMSADFILSREFAAYLPARFVKRHIDNGQLHLVPKAPRFHYPIWATWREDIDPAIEAAAASVLAKVSGISDADCQAVIGKLTQIGIGGDAAALVPNISN